MNDDDNNDIEEDDMGEVEIVSRVKTYPEGVRVLEDVAFFLERKRHADMATETSKLCNEVV